MKRRRLSRQDRARLNRDDGSLAEELVVEEYQAFTSDFTDADTHDLVTDSDGWVEVKSTFVELSNGAAGRFRLWKEQHEGLVRKDQDGTAWYVFVLYDPADGEARMTRRKPAAIGRSIGARGGWNRSGHPSGKQYKLPWEAVF